MAKAKKEKIESVPTPIPAPVTPSAEVFANPSGIALSADNVKVEITQKDKEKFFKAFLSDGTFEDEFSILEKQVKIQFKTLSVDENNDVLKQVNRDWQDGIANTSQSYITTMLIYRFALSLVSITGIKFENDITKEDFVPDEQFKTYIQAKVAKFKAWPTFKLSSLLFAFLQFEKKVMLLETAVNEVNFWKAAE